MLGYLDNILITFNWPNPDYQLIISAIFFVISDSKLRVFGLLFGQKRQLEDVTLDKFDEDFSQFLKIIL